MTHMLTALATLIILPASQAEAAVLEVDCSSGPYFSIQSAVNVAGPGDTVVVAPCTYNENVTVNAMDDVHLVAADTGGTNGSFSAGVGPSGAPAVIIDGTGLLGDCLTIDSSGSISVTGFRFQGCNSGVLVGNSRDVNLHGNWFTNNSFAGYFEYAGFGNVLSGSTIAGNDFGVYIEVTEELRIADNRIGNNSSNGIFSAGDRVQIVNNVANGNGNEGILVGFGSAQRVERNRASGNNSSGGLGNIVIDAGVTGCSAVGNDAAGTLVDLSTSDLSANL